MSKDILVVIDVQVDYCLPQGALGRMGRDMSPTVAVVQSLDPFLQKVRCLGVPVVVVKTESDRLCRPGTVGADLCIQTASSDYLVTKRTYGAFGAPAFVRLLERLSPCRIVLTGVDTHICVETTVREAFDRGFTVEVMRDLVASRGENRELHENSLRVMEKYFATVTSSDHVLARWSRTGN